MSFPLTQDFETDDAYADALHRYGNEVASYHQLLGHARNGTITQMDVDLLNTRVVTELKSQPDRINTCIVRTNKLRHVINRLHIERFARTRVQKIFILSFPERHTRRKKANGMRNLDVDKLLE